MLLSVARHMYAWPLIESASSCMHASDGDCPEPACLMTGVYLWLTCSAASYVTPATTSLNSAAATRAATGLISQRLAGCCLERVLAAAPRTEAA